jgi:AAHS family 4-hydroxybenzoate transporter-like MFS transporter
MLIDDFGWRSVFVIGGAAPLLLMPALVLWLPRVADRGARRAARTPVRDLLRPGLRSPTLLIWLIYFLNLLVLYTLSNWLPTLVHGAGLSIAAASIATTCYQLAGTVGGLAIAWVCDQRPAIRVLAASFLAAGTSVWLLGVAGGERAVVFATAAAAGFFVVGGQNAFAAFVGGFYPSGLKATGLGWAVGVGRLGSVLGPLLAGGLFLVGATPATVFRLCAIPAALAALSVLAVGALRSRARARAPEGGFSVK